jgi:hypothetical protein
MVSAIVRDRFDVCLKARGGDPMSEERDRHEECCMGNCFLMRDGGGSESTSEREQR